MFFIQKKGFTLIELLVVISIIGFFASVTLTAIAQVRVKARVVQSISDLRQVRIAIEAYYQDNGSYPLTGDQWNGFLSPAGSDLGANWIPELLPNYISTLPREPRKTSDEWSQYLYKSMDGKEYKLIYYRPEDCASVKAKYFNLVDPNANDVGICWAYGFWSPGAATHPDY